MSVIGLRLHGQVQCCVVATFDPSCFPEPDCWKHTALLQSSEDSYWSSLISSSILAVAAQKILKNLKVLMILVPHLAMQTYYWFLVKTHIDTLAFF